MVYRESNPKIDVYADGVYQYSTKWSRTCKEAIEKFKKNKPTIAQTKKITAVIDHEK